MAIASASRNSTTGGFLITRGLVYLKEKYLQPTWTIRAERVPLRHSRPHSKSWDHRAYWQAMYRSSYSRSMQVLVGARNGIAMAMGDDLWRPTDLRSLLKRCILPYAVHPVVCTLFIFI